MAQQYCSKCRRTMQDTNFYTYKDGTKCELCKPCLTMHVDNFNPDSFMWLLEKFDVPWIPAEWNVLRDRAYQKDPYKMTGMSVFGKYLSKMKLKQWNQYTYADTERLAEEAEKKAEEFGRPEDVVKQQIEEMREAFERGEITEAQLKTYEEISPVSSTVEAAVGGIPIPTGGALQMIAPVINSDFEQVNLPDVSEQLTEEDKVYLALKWGRLYRADEWVSLEQKYNDFMNSFDIQGAARIDTLKHICKTSLKMDQAIDCGDTESYTKLSRVYTTLMKDAKFTEAQRKEEKTGDFDAVGQIVYFAEKEGGKIPRHDTTVAIDKADEAIMDIKNYTKELIVNDPSLSQMFENLIKRYESSMDHKEDIAKAQAEGLDYVPLTDEDFEEYNDMINEGEEGDIDESTESA